MTATPQTSAPASTSAGPPIAATRPTWRSHHGIEVIDQYEWLRERERPEVMAYIAAENAWTDARTEHLAALQDQLFSDIQLRTEESDVEAPVLVRHHDGAGRARAFWYYQRTEDGLAYPVHCRVEVPVDPEIDPWLTPPLPDLSGDEREQVLLDENSEARGREFFDIGQLAVSPSGRYLAYLVDTTGGEVFDLRIRDLDTGQTLAGQIDGAHYGLAWLGDDTLFYTMPDSSWRAYQVRRRRLSTGVDDAVHTEQDAHFDVKPVTSRDGRAVLISSRSRVTADWRMVTIDDVDAAPVIITPRRAGVDYRVEHAGDRLLILHNHDAEDFALAQAPLSARGAADWSPVLEHRPGVRLLSVDAYDGHVVLSVRRDGLTGLEVLTRNENGDLDGCRSLAPELQVYTMRHEPGANTADRKVRYRLSSLATAPVVMEFDTVTATSQILKSTAVRDHPGFGPFRSSDYVQRREWAVAADGARIPLSIVHRRGALDAGPAPTLLYGYGSYESCSEPGFDIDRLALLDRGVVFAIAHVRGGGELGRHWYEQGRLLSKRNTFTDFVACAQRLIALGLTTPKQLAAQGGSAGGLLMGAVANLAPELFRAIHADVAFVDPLTTCLNPDFPGIVNEWEEWGDPLHDAEAYRYMASYAPYDNIRAVEYPAILATTGLNDIRVYYVEPAKWVAKLRSLALNGSRRPILLRTDLTSGHRGASGRYQAWRQTAFELAWLLDQLGVGLPASAGAAEQP